jgi:hypothetical protein
MRRAPSPFNDPLEFLKAKFQIRISDEDQHDQALVPAEHDLPTRLVVRRSLGYSKRLRDADVPQPQRKQHCEFGADLRPIQMNETASLPAWRWIASLRSQ